MSNLQFYQFNRDGLPHIIIPPQLPSLLFENSSNYIQYNNRTIVPNIDKNPLDKDNLDLLLSKHKKREFHFLNGLVIEVSSFITVSELLDIFNNKRLPVPLITFICQDKRIPLLNLNDILITAFPREKVYIVLALGNCIPTQIN